MIEASSDEKGTIGLFCKLHLEDGRKCLKEKGFQRTKYGEQCEVDEGNQSDSIEEIEERPAKKENFLARAKRSKPIVKP